MTLHRRADRPSLRTLGRWAAKHGKPALAPATVSEMLTGKRLPSKAVVTTFVEACGLSADQVAPWRRAWERVASPPDPQPPPTQANEPPPAQSSASNGADELTVLPQRVDALIGLANVEKEAGNLEKARSLLQRAIEIGNSEQAAGALTDLGWWEKEAWNLEEARRLFQRAIEIGNPWQKGKALICWGVLEHDNARNVEEARRLYERVIETGPPDLSLGALSNLASLERGAGNLDKARRRYQQITEAGNPEAAASALNGWADLERGAGNLERARQLYKQVLDVERPPTEPGK